MDCLIYQKILIIKANDFYEYKLEIKLQIINKLY